MAELIELDDAKVAAMAKKFGVTEAEIRRQWEITVAQGPDAVLAEMNAHVAATEAEIDEVVEETAKAWLAEDPAERLREMAMYYEATWEGVDVDEVNISDLVMKMSIMTYKLAEARWQIAELLDGNRRGRGEDDSP